MTKLEKQLALLVDKTGEPIAELPAVTAADAGSAEKPKRGAKK